MAEGLDFVELVPDAETRPREYEMLADGRERRPPAWLVRAAALCTRTPVGGLALAAIMLGGVLVADGPVHARIAPSPAAGPVGMSSAYFYEGSSRCPVGVVCTVEGRARQDMWASFNALFTGAEAGAGRVWFAPATGVVFSQSLDAATPTVTIRLTQTRVSRRATATSGPTVEFDTPLQWGRVIVPRTVIVSAERGPWEVAATLRGPWDAHMPVAAAREWVMTVPIPN